MNKRQYKKLKNKILLDSLCNAVKELDTRLFPSYKRYKYKYKAYIKKFPYIDSICVYRENYLKIEVREKEGNHNRPHFHARVKGQEVSIALDNYEILAGELDKKYLKIVLDWAADNYNILKSTWEEFHGAVVDVH